MATSSGIVLYIYWKDTVISVFLMTSSFMDNFSINKNSRNYSEYTVERTPLVVFKVEFKLEI